MSKSYECLKLGSLKKSPSSPHYPHQILIVRKQIFRRHPRGPLNTHAPRHRDSAEQKLLLFTCLASEMGKTNMTDGAAERRRANWKLAHNKVCAPGGFFCGPAQVNAKEREKKKKQNRKNTGNNVIIICIWSTSKRKKKQN